MHVLARNMAGDEHSYAAASGLSLNGSGGINNLVAFLSSINPINQTQLTVELSRSPADSFQYVHTYPR